MTLSISEILNGTDDTQEVKIESLNDTVFLRPLSVGEWNKVQEIQQAPLGDYITNERSITRKKRRVKGEMEAQATINIKDSNKGTYDAQIEAIYINADNSENKEDKWSKDKIKKMPKSVFDEIYAKVIEISKIEDDEMEEDVDNFPEN